MDCTRGTVFSGSVGVVLLGATVIREEEEEVVSVGRILFSISDSGVERCRYIFFFFFFEEDSDIALFISLFFFCVLRIYKIRTGIKREREREREKNEERERKRSALCGEKDENMKNF